MMKIAVLTQTNEIYVEFPPDVFVELLEKYLKETNGDVRKAMDLIIVDLKKQTLYK